ncbi:DUF6455 family protein [Methyloceanibacter sp. wino2]|uniref:DUF6455 family protein n=1 Tax=Methyloceanibacter sp. wino2 TaxID=2170729 RepID=UPI000D3ECC30|nr:DUF6455 family protein [Methyloceanibacter sp. wino2]
MTDPKPELAGFHRQVLMEDMMETVGVEQFDVVDLDGGQSYIRARANCHACECKDACTNWLAAHTAGDPQPFCPNATLFQAVKS